MCTLNSKGKPTNLHRCVRRSNYLTCADLAVTWRGCSVVTDKGLTTNTLEKSNTHWCLCDYISQVSTHKPCTHSVHVSAQLAIGIAISANVLLCSLEKHEEHIKIRHHMLFLAKLYEVIKCGTAMARTRDEESYTGTLLS